MTKQFKVMYVNIAKSLGKSVRDRLEKQQIVSKNFAFIFSFYSEEGRKESSFPNTKFAHRVNETEI